MFTRRAGAVFRALNGLRYAATEAKDAGATNNLRLSFAAPDQAFYTKQGVEMVTVPGESGVFGILPNHVPTVAKLQPGVIVVKEKEGVEKRFFVSSGFAIISPKNELTINAVEAVPVENIDKDLARKGLDEFSSKLASATTELDKARAQIGVDVHRALAHAAGV